MPITFSFLVAAWQIWPAGLGLVAALEMRAQSQPETIKPVAYVASIKRNTSERPRSYSEYLPGGRLISTATTLSNLIRIAYSIESYQVIGLPTWASKVRYDIVAKVDADPPERPQTLLRSILEDRFRLTAHNEMRELPAFALVPKRRDGKLGSDLTRSAFDCATYLTGPHPLPDPGHTPTCGVRTSPGFLSGNAITMSQLASSLAPLVHRLTTDKTNMPGAFNVELRWTPEQALPTMTDNPLPAVASDVPELSIFTALQEQLGLRLAEDKDSVKVLVVDHVEEPSEN